MITTTGFCASDIICQGIEYKYGNKTNLHNNNAFVWDKPRTLKFTLIGFTFGPQFHYWIPFVSGLISGHGGKAAFKKVVIDQVGMGSWATIYVLSMKALMEGEGIKGAKMNVKQNFWDVYLRACCIFPPGQFINYLLIPPNYRVFWLNGIGFCWRIILSYLVYGNRQKQDLVNE